METKAIFVGFTVPPSLEDIQEIAESIIDELPEGMTKYIRKLKVTVEDFPDAFVEQELELDTPFDLLGCYQSAGPALAGHLGAGTKRQDTLYLYRRPILDQWADSSEDLTQLVNRVILHEIGHHFGFTPEDIEMYEEDMFGATALHNDAG
ncbi:MAG: metallopeptidase family protein [Alphaproteobacteria bacterium]|nr:metallopeptidase family protein [Alphaproteobacteria bacterium]